MRYRNREADPETYKRKTAGRDVGKCDIANCENKWAVVRIRHGRNRHLCCGCWQVEYKLPKGIVAAAPVADGITFKGIEVKWDTQ